MNRTIETGSISTHADLKLRIMRLNAIKEEQEEVIKHNIKELYYSIHPGYMLKEALHSWVQDTGVKNDLKKAGLHIGADLAIWKLFGRNSFARYISSIATRKTINYLVDNYQEVFATGLSKLKKIFKPAEG